MRDPQTVMITGGAGFIGSALIRMLIRETRVHVINVDALTYAGNLDALAGVRHHGRYRFEKCDICDRAAMDRVLQSYRPDAVMHLAAETHVDRSIERPADFVQSNIVGTFTLLESLRHWRQADFIFHHVSTDEVYGSLDDNHKGFCEQAAYRPNSPYAASKAGADHLVRAWHHSYGMPVVISNCSNNYGPYQYPEKLIPLMIGRALAGRPLPLYGDGQQVRDWLHVDDHVRGLWSVLQNGAVGEHYNIAANMPKSNLEVVRTLCALLNELSPTPAGVADYAQLITHVSDRPGHDRRYGILTDKIQQQLHWRPVMDFDHGLRETICWYLRHRHWLQSRMPP